MKPFYEDEYIQIYHGNSLEILPTLQGIGSIVTDPPYGIPEKWGKEIVGNNGSSRLWVDGANEWDTQQPLWFMLYLASMKAVIWGGNFYQLPNSPSWLIWDKVQKFDGSDFEMAWTNIGIAPRVFRMARIDAYVNQAKFRKEHPTEKPVQLFSWCIQQIKGPGLICDPYMGSGNSLVAAKELGLKAIGIDAKLKYCEIAANRVQGVTVMHPALRGKPNNAGYADRQARQLPLD